MSVSSTFPSCSKISDLEQPHSSCTDHGAFSRTKRRPSARLDVIATVLHTKTTSHTTTSAQQCDNHLLPFSLHALFTRWYTTYGRRCTHHGWTSRWLLNVEEEHTRMHIVALERTQCETSIIMACVTPAHTAPRKVNHNQVWKTYKIGTVTYACCKLTTDRKTCETQKVRW